jgi:hypothetical protein
MATNLGGVELWDLSGVHVMMDARRTVALSSAVVASIGPGKVNALTKMGRQWQRLIEHVQRCEFMIVGPFCFPDSQLDVV